MCGIAGIIGRSETPKEALDEMLNRIVHRGPDDSGTYVDADIALGMRRLSIIDVEGGKQPISSEDGSLIIVFNGEIYNFKELREELLKTAIHLKQTRYRSNFARRKRRRRCCERVMNVHFIIYDMKRESICRSRLFGIKPLLS